MAAVAGFVYRLAWVKWCLRSSLWPGFPGNAPMRLLRLQSKNTAWLVGTTVGDTSGVCGK